jgi:hypothetical protein
MFVLPAAIISLAAVLAYITRNNKRSSQRSNG